MAMGEEKLLIIVIPLGILMIGAGKIPKYVVRAETYQEDKGQALIDAFIEMDENFSLKMEKDGTTAVVALITQDNKVYVANAGDSRCVLGRDGQAIPLSEDHKPTDKEEKARIEEAGHEVIASTTVVDGIFNTLELTKGKRVTEHRVDGILAVSRAIGDNDFKDNFGEPPEKQAITCIPDIREEQLQGGDVLILACDGVWDVMTNDQVVAFVDNNRSKTPTEIAAALGDEAIARESGDNITVVVVCVQ